MKIGDRDPTPPLAEFRAAYEEEPNWWWAVACGHHQNLFDEACDEIDRLREQLARADASLSTGPDGRPDEQVGS